MFPSIPMLKAVFPSVSVCSSPADDSLRPQSSARVVVLPCLCVPQSSHACCSLSSVACLLLPADFPQFVFPVFSQPSAFSCPSAQASTLSTPVGRCSIHHVVSPYVWWSHHSVSSCFSLRTSFGPISSLSSASLPRCLLPLSVVSVRPQAHSRSPVASSWLPVLLPV
jgi:hypothetical protein